MHRTISIALLLAGLCALPHARAAESYDNCTGFIDSLPATIGTQGTWCMRKDLSTGMSSGWAVTINTNNVTIDCNHFKLGGLAAGTASDTFGIVAINRQNISVRNCNVRGFLAGAYLMGPEGGGHLVEDSRFDGNRLVGIGAEGRGSVVRHNQVLDTGGYTGTTFPGTTYGIFTASGTDVLDNIVDGVTEMPSLDGVVGIQSNADDLSAAIVGNRIRNLVAADGNVLGINRSASGIAVFSRNYVFGTGDGTGIVCNQLGIDSARENVVINFQTGIGIGCVDDGGNTVRNAPL